MKVYLEKRLFILIIFVFAIPLYGDYKGSGAEFLRYEVGAAPSAMGGAYTSLAEGAIATYWNPAGIIKTNKFSCVFSHNEVLLDMKTEFAALTFRTPFGVIGTSFNTFNSGILKGYDELGYPTGEFSARSNCLSFSYAIGFIRPIDTGISFKYIWERIENSKASTIAFDIGARTVIFRTFRVGIVIQNLGPGENFISETSPLPITLRLGSAFAPFTNKKFSETISADFSMVMNGRRCLHLGSETTIYKMIHLRVGYRFSSIETAEKFTCGAGVSLNKLIPAFENVNLKIDFSQTFGSVEGLGNISRMTMIFDL
ncbi:MAG: PorV/PorQ family protein [bacterium]